MWIPFIIGHFSLESLTASQRLEEFFMIVAEPHFSSKLNVPLVTFSPMETGEDKERERERERERESERESNYFQCINPLFIIALLMNEH